MIYLSSEILDTETTVSQYTLSETVKSQLYVALTKKEYIVHCNVPNQTLQNWIAGYREPIEYIINVKASIGSTTNILVKLPFRATEIEKTIASHIATETIFEQCLLFMPNAINLGIYITVKSPDELIGITNTIVKWLLH